MTTAIPNRDREGAADSHVLTYLITFPTHGTWLHGDERGSVDREHNIPGRPLPYGRGSELYELTEDEICTVEEAK